MLEDFKPLSFDIRAANDASEIVRRELTEGAIRHNREIRCAYPLRGLSIFAVACSILYFYT
jgi:hypothetical protein